MARDLTERIRTIVTSLASARNDKMRSHASCHVERSRDISDCSTAIVRDSSVLVGMTKELSCARTLSESLASGRRALQPRCENALAIVPVPTVSMQGAQFPLGTADPAKIARCSVPCPQRRRVAKEAARDRSERCLIRRRLVSTG